MDPVSIAALVGTISSIINNVATQIMAIKRLIDQIKAADATLMSLVAQLSTIKAALCQIKDLIQIANYDAQLQMDLELSLHASQLHIDLINSNISKLKTKNAASTLRFHSKLKVVFESESMDKCLERLNHQAIALNLLITVLTSKSVHEQKAVLLRTNTRKVFKQIQEDQASLLDEAASIVGLRDQDSVRNAVARSESEPTINKNPWKRFAFDPQVWGSRAYGGKLLRRVSDNDAGERTQIEEERELQLVDDADTLVGELWHPSMETSQINLDPDLYDHKCIPRFSKMLAFGHAESDISTLISHARHLWDVPDSKISQSSDTDPSFQAHRLSTRYFDIRIHAHTFEEYQRHSANDDILARHRDVSSILFAVNLEEYQFNSGKLERDLELFRSIVNDYHLWLAKIVLFLNTANLDPYRTHGISEDLKRRFMQAGRAGASDDRIHVVTGEADEMAAGTIFAIGNETGRVPTNKWAGLTKWPTN